MVTWCPARRVVKMVLDRGRAGGHCPGRRREVICGGRRCMLDAVRRTSILSVQVCQDGVTTATEAVPRRTGKSTFVRLSLQVLHPYRDFVCVFLTLYGLVSGLV